MSVNTCQAHNIITADYYERIPKAFQQKSDPDIVMEFGFITALDFIEIILNLINQICILLTLFGVTYICKRLNFEKTAFHAFLCTLGLICLLAQGMIVRYPSNLILQGVEPGTKHVIHFLLLGIGGLMGLIGTAQKMIMKKVHFNTTHGKFGLAACIFWTINVILGISTYRRVDSPKELSSMILRTVHNFVGILTLIMSCFSQYCGYKSGFFRRNFSNQGVYRKMIILILILTAIGPIKICVENLIIFKHSLLEDE